LLIRLDAFHVAKSGLVAGDAIVRRLPRGYERFRCARAEANEAAAALEAAVALGLAPADAAVVLHHLDRVAAMLMRLGGFGG
jgi:hypothetical protein